jgi:hypothetical protein
MRVKRQTTLTVCEMKVFGKGPAGMIDMQVTTG